MFSFVFFLKPAKKKQRAQVIEFFIDVARECFNIGNFNSLMAIICESHSVICELEMKMICPTTMSAMCSNPTVLQLV